MAKDNQQPFEATLQDLVYSLDAGTGLKIVRTVLFCLMVLIIAVFFTASQFRGFNSEAAMDYAQLGRNLAQKHRYVTQCVRPLTIHQVSVNRFDGNAKIEFHPELTRAPAYPAMLAGCFAFFDFIGVDLFPDSKAFQGSRFYPAEQWVIVPLHHAFSMLSGLLIYFLGRKLFSHKIGVLGTSTYFLSAMVWEDGLHGTAIPMLTFFLLGAVYCAVESMIRRRERGPLFSWMLFYLLSIVFSALAFLTNYAAIAVFPGVALFILLMGTLFHRSGHLAFFYLVLILILVSPWLLRNYQVAGSPLGLAPHQALVETDRYPDDALMRTLPEDSKSPFNLMSDFAAARKKCAKNFNAMYQNRVTSMGGGFLISFFVVTYFYRFVRVHVHALHWGIGLSMVLFIAGASFFEGESFRTYHVFWPFVILYGLAFFSILLDRLDLSIELYKSAITFLVITLTAIPLIVTIFIAPPPAMAYPPYHPPFIMRVSELLKPNEIMCSDMPWATAWYGKRTSILLPKNLDDYYVINDYRKYISGLYITTLTKDKPFISSLAEGPEKTWLPISMGSLPEDFPLRQGFPLNNQDQIFLTDSIRWGGSSQAQDGEEKSGAEAAE